MSPFLASSRVELMPNKSRLPWCAKTLETRPKNTDKRIGWGRESIQQKTPFPSIQEDSRIQEETSCLCPNVRVLRNGKHTPLISSPGGEVRTCFRAPQGEYYEADVLESSPNTR
jgi:hypothetical protein